MIGVDTNILVRFFIRDDEGQYRKSLSIFEEESVFIPDTVLLETEWVLRYTYAFTPDQIVEAFTGLLGLSNVHVLNPQQISQAIEWHKEGMDFADAIHIVLSGHCNRFFTFDRKLVTKAKKIGPCEVLKA